MLLKHKSFKLWSKIKFFSSFSRLIGPPSAASPPFLSLFITPSLPTMMFARFHLPPCWLTPLPRSVLWPSLMTLFSPPFYSSACFLPFIAKPHDRVVYSLQFLNVHSVPGCVLLTSGRHVGIVRLSPFSVLHLFEFSSWAAVLVFLGMPHSALCRLSVGRA